MYTARFSVTYEIVTAQSAAFGEVHDRGYACESVSLRDALDELKETRTAACDGVECIEPDSVPCLRPRFVTIINGTEFQTGAQESRTLHFPDGITAASARRIARLIGVRPDYLAGPVLQSPLPL